MWEELHRDVCACPGSGKRGHVCAFQLVSSRRFIPFQQWENIIYGFSRVCQCWIFHLGKVSSLQFFPLFPQSGSQLEVLWLGESGGLVPVADSSIFILLNGQQDRAVSPLPVEYLWCWIFAVSGENSEGEIC